MVVQKTDYSDTWHKPKNLSLLYMNPYFKQYNRCCLCHCCMYLVGIANTEDLQQANIDQVHTFSMVQSIQHFHMPSLLDTPNTCSGRPLVGIALSSMVHPVLHEQTWPRIVPLR